MILAVSSFSTTAQPLQKIYSDLDNATSISVTQNSIYIVEQGEDRLLKLDHTGKILETIGGRGSGNYQFSKPVDVDATNGLKIFVTDHNNRRVQVFDRRGQFLSSLEGRTSFGLSNRYSPTEVSVSDVGEVYFIDDENRNMYHFDLDYNLLDEYRLPSEIESFDDLVIGPEEIRILDRRSKTIHVLTWNGAYQGFQPADHVLAFFSDESGNWMAYEDQLINESKSGEKLTVNFEASIQPVDMYVERETIFLLTESALYKLVVSER